MLEVAERPPVWMVAPVWLEDAPDTPTTAEIARTLRNILPTVDFADYVLRTSATYYTNATDRIIADHALDIFERDNVARKRISATELSARSGLSRKTCRNAMQRLSWMLPEIEEKQRRTTDTPLYHLSIENLPRALVHILHDLCARARGDITLQTHSDICATPRVNLTAHAGQDALVRSLSRITPEELARRNEAREAEGLPAMARTAELQRRLAAKEDAPGRNVMILIDALLRYGQATRKELETVLHLSRGAVYRMLVKAHDAGLIEDDNGRVSLVEDWSIRVEHIGKDAPTAGTAAKRKRQAIESKYAYLSRAMADPARTPAQLQRLGQRLTELKEEAYRLMQPEIDAHNQRRAAAGIGPVNLEIVMTPGPDFWTLKTRKDANELAKEIQGMTKEEVFYYGSQLGYSFADIDMAWKIRRGLS